MTQFGTDEPGASPGAPDWAMMRSTPELAGEPHRLAGQFDVRSAEPRVKRKCADIERGERHAMVGDRVEQRPASGLALQQRVDVEERFRILPAGRKLDPGDTQVTGTRKRLVERRQARGLGVESDLHARSFPSAAAASPETDERHDSTARRGH